MGLNVLTFIRNQYNPYQDIINNLVEWARRLAWLGRRPYERSWSRGGGGPGFKSPRAHSMGFSPPYDTT